MLNDRQLRDALRKGMFLRLKRLFPELSNQGALLQSRLDEQRAWKRRNPATVADLRLKLDAAALAALESRFQAAFDQAAPIMTPAGAALDAAINESTPCLESQTESQVA